MERNTTMAAEGGGGGGGGRCQIIRDIGVGAAYTRCLLHLIWGGGGGFGVFLQLIAERVVK